MKKRIALVMQDLLWPDNRFVYSGGDRYTRDMVHLVKELGHEPYIFQKSQKYEDVEVDGRKGKRPLLFQTEWEGAKVTGIPCKTIEDLNIQVSENAQEFDAFIYFHMILAYPRVHRKSVSMSHGIWFDHVRFPPASDDKYDIWRKYLESAIAGVERIVSVDTNTINFMGGLFAGRYHHKFTHIPNYVDTSLYKPGSRKAGSKVRVLYPRRWDVIRGQVEFLRMVDALEDKYPNVEWHMCGRSSNDDNESVGGVWASQKPNRAYYWKPFDEMPAVYREADIAVIPTQGCEGTSLSALEAMASGVPLVTTYVGGLSELVIDGYNGLKVSPRFEEIRNAVEWLIRHPSERERMGRNARLIGEKFSQDKWKAKWGSVIDDLLR